MTLSIRPATKADESLALSWGGSRGFTFAAGCFPPVGCVAEDESGPACMLWACIVLDSPIAFIEFAASRPGLKVAQTRAAFHEAMEGLKKACEANGVQLLIAYARAGFARELRRMGWEDGCQIPKVAMICPLNPPEVPDESSTVFVAENVQ